MPAIDRMTVQGAEWTERDRGMHVHAELDVHKPRTSVRITGNLESWDTAGTRDITTIGLGRMPEVGRFFGAALVEHAWVRS